MDKQYESYDVPPGTVSDEELLPEELRPIAQWYATQSRPRLTPEASQQLLMRLEKEEVVITHIPFLSHQPLGQTLHVVRWQLRLLGSWFWIMSMLLLLSGCTLAPLLPKNMAITLLIYIFPLTALLSITYAVRRLSPGLRDIEASTPTGFVEMMAGVVLTLACFDGILGLLASSAMALAQWAPFSLLVITWLGPLLLLVALSFPIALRWGTLPAIIVGGAPWLLLMIMALFFPGSSAYFFLWVPQDGFSITAHLLATGLGMVILLVLLLYGSNWQRAFLQ